jgi:tetratricopeptide (TPR) repeat protein
MAKRLAIAKLKDKIDAGVKSSAKDVESYYASTKVAHILVSTSLLPEAQAKTRAEKILAELKAGKRFEDLAKEFSDDPQTKKTGGVLPERVTWGSGYVSEFKRAALALPQGEISGLVKTRYGYHIIKSLERKVEYPKDFEKHKAKYRKEVRTAMADEKWSEYSESVMSRPDRKPVIESPEFQGYWALYQVVLAKSPQERDKRVEEAIGDFERALTKGSSDPDMMCALALAYEQVNEKQKAAAIYVRALQHTESDDIEMRLGGIYEELGQKQKAVDAYDMASQVGYNKPELLDQLAERLERLGRPDLAQRNRKDAAQWREYQKRLGKEGGAPGQQGSPGPPSPGE